MKVQRIDTLVEEVAVRLPEQAVHQGRVKGGWASRIRRSTNHSFSGQRGATRVIATGDDSRTRAITRPPGEREGTLTGPSRPKDGGMHPRRWPGDLGLARNTGAVLR